MSWWSRLSNALRSSHLDEALDEEQRFHIDSRAGDLEAQGLSRREALAQASRQFGHRLQLREASRDVKLSSRAESLARDVRFGLRLLRKDAVVSVAAVLSLGLAIGACTAAFSLIDALILRELPVRDPHGLAYLTRTGPTIDPRFSTLISYPFFERARQALSPHMDVFGMSQQSLRQARLPDTPDIEEKLQTQFVSGNAFAALGVQAALGRVLAPSDDVTPGAHPVAVISHALWARRFAGNPAALGRSIWLEGHSYGRRRRAGRLHWRPARDPDRRLAAQPDVPARDVHRPELELAAGVGQAGPRCDPRDRSTDCRDHAGELRDEAARRKV